MSSPTSPYVMRCHYDVLEIDRKVDEDEIKRAYKKMALKYHPDKNRDNIEEATAKFKEVQNAYGVLSDPDERAWYDSHREKILRGGDARGDHGAGGSDDDDSDDGPEFLNIFKYFGTKSYTSTEDPGEKGFYGVFDRVFSTIALEDCEFMPRDFAQKCPYPRFGDAGTEWQDVQRFYQFWQSYSTKKSYAWKDEYKINELPDRQMRRAAEKINLGHREAAKREYSRAVQSLVDQVYRNDPRVEAEQRRIEERLKLREEERERKAEEAMRRRADERKKWMEEAKEQEKLVSVSEETEILEQLYAMRTSNKPKQPPKQPTTPLYTTDAHGNEIKIVAAPDQDGQSDGESGKKFFRCEHCKKTFNNERMFTEHCNSNKHKAQLKKLGIDPNKMANKGDSEGDGVAAEGDEAQHTQSQPETPTTVAGALPSSSPASAASATSSPKGKKGQQQQQPAPKGKTDKKKLPSAKGEVASSSSSDADDGDEGEGNDAQSSKPATAANKKQKKKAAQQLAQQAKAKQMQQMRNLGGNDTRKGSSSSDSDDGDSSSSDDDDHGAPPQSKSKFGTFQTGSSKKKK